MVTIQRVQLEDTATHRQVDRLRRQGNEQAEKPIAQGALVTATLADGTETSLKHRLGKKPNGFLLASLKGATSAGYILTVSADKDAITLQANAYGADIDVSLWVF